MKALFPILCALLSGLTLHAQISVEASAPAASDNSKTIFVYRDADVPVLDELTSVIKDSWSFNTIELMSSEDFSTYQADEGEMVFVIDYDYMRTMSVYTNGHTGPGNNYVDFYLTLYQKTADGYSMHSRSSLSVSGATIIDVCRTKKTPEEIINDQYKSSLIFSWNFAYLETIMHTVSAHLADGKAFSTEKQAAASLSGLKEKTLYITDAAESKQNRMSGAEKKMHYQKAIDKAYDYKHEIVTNEKINELVTSGSDGYVFMFQKIGKGKALIVIDLSTSEIVYYKAVNNKYAFEAKDISALNAAIVKG